jgi:hypothetical protein
MSLLKGQGQLAENGIKHNMLIYENREKQMGLMNQAPTIYVVVLGRKGLRLINIL